LNLESIPGPPPQRVEVTGPSKVTVNSESEFTCRSAPSQPAAQISWLIRINNVTVDLGEGRDIEIEKVSGRKKHHKSSKKL
jgi:hypothetical protein